MFYEYVITHFSETAQQAMYWMSVFCATCTLAASAYLIIDALRSNKKGKANREHE